MYAAVAFIMLQVADLTFPALRLSENAYRIVVLVTFGGFPVAVVLAWFFDFSAGVRLDRSAPVPRALQKSPGRPFQLLSIAIIVLLVTGAGGVTALRARLNDARALDGRIAIAVFPFRAVGLEGAEWSEGVPDLLATALDGTEGLRIIDPWVLWRGLREAETGQVSSPDPEEAATLASDLGARRMVLGSIVNNGDRVDVSVRIYDPRFVRALHTFAVTSKRTQLPALVERLSIDVITRVWDQEILPGTTRLEPNITQSAEALKAYLAARAAMRHGWVDSAVNAITHAITADSTFSLALIDAVGIRSWQLSMTGTPYAGFFELIDRAQRHADSLSERNRLRLLAMHGAVQTNGRAAADALHRIIELDSADIGAWSLLSYVRNVYGYQYGGDAAGALAAARRVLELDSTHVPGLVAEAWLSLAVDSTNFGSVAARLAQADTTVAMARATLRAVRLLAASDRDFETLKRAVATAPLIDWVTAIRFLRAFDPARAESLLEFLSVDPAAAANARIARGEQARLFVAEGRTEAVDAALRAGTYPVELTPRLNRLLVAAGLAGLSYPDAEQRAVLALRREVPFDSALAYFNTRPAWLNVWLVGAHHAQKGDTAAAVRARALIGQFPAGGSPAQYREALQADIESRLAARAGDHARALAAARRAYDLWSIHTEIQHEFMPEPAIRFNLAMQLVMSGNTAAAVPILRSLVPPTSWFGFYTTRAHFELGEIAAARGDRDAARPHYANALRYWSKGGREIEAWRASAQRQLARVRERAPQ